MLKLFEMKQQRNLYQSILKKTYHSVSARLLMNSSATCPKHLVRKVEQNELKQLAITNV